MELYRLAAVIPQRQRKKECIPLAWLAFHPHAATLPHDDFVSDIKSQTQALNLLFVVIGSTVETFKNVGPVLLANASPFIFYRDDSLTILPLHSYHDRPATGTILDSIADQVVQYPLQMACIPVASDGLLACFKSQQMIIFVLFKYLAYQRHDIDIFLFV